jgi:hypothetical protein
MRLPSLHTGSSYRYENPHFILAFSSHISYWHFIPAKKIFLFTKILIYKKSPERTTA